MIDDDLGRVMATHLDGPVRYASTPKPLTGGFWATIHAFELADAPEPFSGPLVIRVMPDRAAGVRESLVQQTVASQGFGTPPVLAAGVDEALGGPYIVMPRVAGEPLLGGLSLGPSLFGLPGVLHRLPGQLATAAIELHQLDPAPLERALDAAGVSAGFRSVANRHEEIAAAASLGARGFAEVSVWLADRVPDTESTAEAVVCHGDLHPFNLLRDTDGNVTVLDWTNARIMPPEFEVGLTAGLLRCAPMSVPGLLRPVVERLTDRLASRFIEAYGASAPLDAALVDGFEALQHARCLAEVVSARRGETHVVGPKHPFETAAPAMIRRLADLTSITVTLPPRQPVPAS